MNSEPSETLLEVMECIGNELSLQRDANEPLSRYAERLVDEIDLAIPKMWRRGSACCKSHSACSGRMRVADFPG
jgi:hypothetical protein